MTGWLINHVCMECGHRPIVDLIVAGGAAAIMTAKRPPVTGEDGIIIKRACGHCWKATKHNIKAQQKEITEEAKFLSKWSRL